MKILAALLFIITSSICWGQDATKTDRALLAIDGAAKAGDFYFTTHNLALKAPCKSKTLVGNYCYSVETNPVARPFVSHGRPLTAGYFAGCFVLDAVLSHELRKHGHSKIARAVVLFGIIDNTEGAVTSARSHIQ